MLSSNGLYTTLYGMRYYNVELNGETYEVQIESSLERRRRRALSAPISSLAV
jgi:hypothetical protein